MARGNRIIITSEPRGKMEEGIVAAGNTFKPGLIVQQDPTVALKHGRHSYKLYDRAADGDHPQGAFWVVTEGMQGMAGGTLTSDFAAGEQVQLYCPLPGDELNLVVSNLSGTADDHAAGAILMVDDGTGELVATTGSPETEVAMLLEAIVDPVADTLAWCRWTGY